MIILCRVIEKNFNFKMRFYVMQRIWMTAVFLLIIEFVLCRSHLFYIYRIYQHTIHQQHTTIKSKQFHTRIKNNSDVLCAVDYLFNSNSQVPQFQFNQQSFFRTFTKLSFKYIPSCFSKICIYVRYLIFGICYLFFYEQFFSLHFGNSYLLIIFFLIFIARS